MYSEAAPRKIGTVKGANGFATVNGWTPEPAFRD